jgi:hypothetical protein
LTAAVTTALHETRDQDSGKLINLPAQEGVETDTDAVLNAIVARATMK